MMLDSGTMSRITALSDRVTYKFKTDVPISLADDSTMYETEAGQRNIATQVYDGEMIISLSNTPVGPDAGLSLLSVPALARNDIGVTFIPGFTALLDLRDEFFALGYAKQEDDSLIYLNDDGSTCIQASAGLTVRKVTAMMVKAMCNVHCSQASDSIRVDSPATCNGARENDKEMRDSKITWLLRLRHALLIGAIRREIKSGHLLNIACQTPDCDICTHAKMRRRFTGSITGADVIGTLHVFTKVAIKTESMHGHNYFDATAEKFTRFEAVRPIRRKSDAAGDVFQYVRYFEKQSRYTVKKIHTNGGSEFKCALSKLFENGVEIRMTTEYTPESIGLVERTHQSITSNAHACLRYANLPLKYWNCVIAHVMDYRHYVRLVKKCVSPYVKLFARSVGDLSHLRPFGCRILFRPVANRLNLLQSRAEDGHCLYHDGGGMYHIFDGNWLVRTKHAEAREQEFSGMALFNQRNIAQIGGNVEYTNDDNEDELPSTSDAPAKPPTYQEPDENALTYIPAEPSRYGESDSERGDVDSDGDCDDGKADHDVGQSRSER